MSERIVLTMGDEGWIIENLWRGATHPGQNECPGCGASVMRTAIIKLVYSFMDCGCDHADYVHLVERLWHPSCYVEARSELPVRQIPEMDTATLVTDV